MSRGTGRSRAEAEEAVTRRPSFAVWSSGSKGAALQAPPYAYRDLTAGDVIEGWRREHGSREVPPAVLALAELLAGDLDVAAVASGGEIIFLVDATSFYDRAPERVVSSER